MTYIVNYTVVGDGEMTRGSVAPHHDPIPGVGDTIRVFMRGRDTVLDVKGVHFGATNYGIQHVNLDCSPSNRTL